MLPLRCIYYSSYRLLSTTTKPLVTRQCSYPARTFSITHQPLNQAPVKSQSSSPELDPAFVEAFKRTTLFEKISHDPHVLKEIATFARLLKDRGIDPTTSGSISPLQMFKLLADSEFKEAAKRLAEEFKRLDINLKSQEVIQELMALKQYQKPTGPQ